MIFQPPSRNALQKSLDSQLDQGTTSSMTLNNVTGVQAPGVVVINRIDTNNAQKSASAREYVSFTGISGNTLTGLTRALGGSTDQDHAVGSVVEFVFDVVQAQAIHDALRETVDTDGALDTTKVVDLTTAQTLTNKTLTSPKINENVALTATATELNLLDGVTSLPSGDGWTEAGETWTYASATTFTVSGDVTAKYQKGTRIKLTQTTTKYFVVTNSVHSAGTTTVTITGGTDYTLANAAITANYYSYQASPQGYPSWFSWTITVTPSGSMTYTAGNTQISKFMVIGNTCFVKAGKRGVLGGTLSNSLSINAPITPANSETIGYCQWNVEFVPAQEAGYAKTNTAGSISLFLATASNFGSSANERYFRTSIEYEI